MNKEKLCPICKRPMIRMDMTRTMAQCSLDSTHLSHFSDIGKKCPQCDGTLEKRNETYTGSWACPYCQV